MKKIFVLLLAAMISVASVMTASAAYPYVKSPGGGGGSGSGGGGGSSSGGPGASGTSYITYNDNTTVPLVDVTTEYSGSYTKQVGAVNPQAAESLKSSGTFKISLLKGARSDGQRDVVVYTDYPDTASIISDSSRAAMSAAYASIQAVNGRVDKYVPAVANMAVQAGFVPEQLYMADLFDLSYYVVNSNNTYTYSEDYKGVHVELTRPELKDQFVAVMQRVGDQWKIVEAKWNGNTLVFDVANLTEFAIFCAGDLSILDSGGKRSPKTGDQTLIWAAYAAGFTALMLCGGYILIRRRKHE